MADGQKCVVPIRSAALIPCLGSDFLQFTQVCTTQISDNIKVYILRRKLSQEFIDVCSIRLLYSQRRPRGEYYIFPVDLWKVAFCDFFQKARDLHASKSSTFPQIMPFFPVFSLTDIRRASVFAFAMRKGALGGRAAVCACMALSWQHLHPVHVVAAHWGCFQMRQEIV